MIIFVLITERIMDFIKVNKITFSKKLGVHQIKVDTIRVADIKSFRTFLDDEDDSADIKKKPSDFENMTQVSVLSPTASEGFYTIRINESEDSFGKRLKSVIPLPAENG